MYRVGEVWEQDSVNSKALNGNMFEDTNKKYNVAGAKWVRRKSGVEIREAKEVSSCWASEIIV